MITTIRASKRIALGGFLGFGLLFICILAVKDMNDKLGVMTASNAGYQKMTDSQTDKIKNLNNEIEALRASKVSELKIAQDDNDRLMVKIEDLKKKYTNLSKEKKESRDKLDNLNDIKTHLESERDELKRLSGRQKQDAEQLSIQLRDQIARISMDRDSCQRQYDALYKLHQETADKVSNLANEKQRLQLQLTDVSASKVAHNIASNSASIMPNAVKPVIVPSPSSTSSTKSSKQLQMPGVANPLMKQKSSSSQPVNLEEPQLPPHHVSTSKGGSPANVAPVGAQPPVHGNPEVVPMHQIGKEDVMEAPKVIQPHFENMDAQIDPIQQDHPGLQAPVYRDNRNVAFDEDDIEDTADGQIPQDYQNDKAMNPRYDHGNDLDYDDFQADFQPHVKQPQIQLQPQQQLQQKIYRSRQLPIGSNQLHPDLQRHQQQLQQQQQHPYLNVLQGGHQYLAPQVHANAGGNYPQLHYRRGLR